MVTQYFFFGWKIVTQFLLIQHLTTLFIKINKLFESLTSDFVLHFRYSVKIVT